MSIDLRPVFWLAAVGVAALVMWLLAFPPAAVTFVVWLVAPRMGWAINVWCFYGWAAAAWCAACMPALWRALRVILPGREARR